MKVYIDCVGCEQRKLDTQLIINYLKSNQIKIVERPQLCDYAIIVTCAVDSSNEMTSLSKIEDIYSSMPKSAKFIVGGCLPSINPKKLLEYQIHQTFSPRNMEILDSVMGDNLKVPLINIPYPNKSNFDFTEIFENDKEMSPRDEYEMAKKNFKIRINQGCLGDCSYCGIRKATGKLHSQPLEDIIRQFEDGVSRNEKTIMLMGGDTGAYGIDIGTGFYTLLKELMEIPGEYKIFIHDFNVNWLIKDLHEYVKLLDLSKKERKIRAINFPVQSGSDEILTSMRRPYGAEQARQAIKQLKKYKSIKIGTHVMVGFPGETEEDLDLTIDLLEDVDFDFVSCFPYSEHEITDSARIPNKIDGLTVDKRLSKISKRMGNKVTVHR